MSSLSSDDSSSYVGTANVCFLNLERDGLHEYSTSPSSLKVAHKTKIGYATGQGRKATKKTSVSGILVVVMPATLLKNVLQPQRYDEQTRAKQMVIVPEVVSMDYCSSPLSILYLLYI